MSEFVHRDLILALVRYANLTTEYENLRKHKRGLIQTSALYFFTIMMNVPDEQIQYVMVDKYLNIFSYSSVKIK